jgi:hypothetical protein
MNTVVELIRSSAVVQGVIACIVIGGVVYQVVTGVPVNETLAAMATLILGFYFGTKVQQGIQAGVDAAAAKQGG